MIANLTNDMMRLCSEITAAQDSRSVLRSKLAQDRAGRGDTVCQMLADFRNSREAMAAKTKAELQDFVESVQEAVAGVKQGVACLREGFLQDIAGAHRAWRGNICGRALSRMAGEKPAQHFAPKAKKRKH